MFLAGRVVGLPVVYFLVISRFKLPVDVGRTVSHCGTGSAVVKVSSGESSALHSVVVFVVAVGQISNLFLSRRNVHTNAHRQAFSLIDVFVRVLNLEKVSAFGQGVLGGG